MKKKVKRILSILLALAMVAGLIPVMPGSSVTTEAAVTALYINEQASGGTNTAVDVSTDSSGTGWSYEKDTNALTLDGFNGSYIEATGDITILLKGSNTITPAADAINAVKVTGTLTIDKTTDDDTDILKIKNLAMTGSIDKYMLYGSDNVVLNGGTVDIEVATTNYIVISGLDRVTLNNEANLKIVAESGNTPYGTRSLMYVYDAADVDISVKGTKVYQFGGIAVGNFYAYGSGQINLKAESTEGKPVLAISSLQKANLQNGGKITATGMVAQHSVENRQQIGQTVEVSPEERMMVQKNYSGNYYNIYCDKEGNPYDSMTFTGTDTSQPLTFTDSSLWDIPAGKTGEKISSVFLDKGICGVGSGSAATYEIIEGSLPEGITMESYGMISGTPTAECDAGTVKIRATDARKNTVEFEIAYGAVTEPDRYLTIDSSTYNMKNDASGTGWSYNGESTTLTLDGFAGSYIASEKNLNILLKGSNTITPAADAINAVKVTGTLTIDKTTDDDTDILKIRNLAMTGSVDKYILYGSDNVVLNGGTVDIEVATTGYIVISGLNRVTLNNAANLKIVAESGNTPYGTQSLMYVYDTADVDISVKGTKVYQFGGIAVGNFYAYGSGQINLKAESTEGKPVLAISSLQKANLQNGGKITATGMVAQHSTENRQQIGQTVEVSPTERMMVQKNYSGNYYNIYCDKEGNPYDSMTFTGTDTSQPLTFTDSSLWDIPAGKTGENISSVFLDKGLCGVGSGSAATYEIIEGSLPEGITLKSYGMISGTPTAECDAGTVKIRATDMYKNTVEFEIAYGAMTVPTPITSVTLDKEELVMNQKDTYTLTATVLPDEASIKTVTWKSDESSIAKVESGVVTAVKPGKAEITVTTTQGNLTDTCTIYVKENTPEATAGSSYIEGLVANADYTIGGAAVTADDHGQIAIDDSWRETTVSIIKTNSETKCNSDAQNLEIPKKDVVDIATLSGKVVLDYSGVSYDGNAKEPEVTIEGLVENTDFTVSYSNNINVGTATITITGKGDYYGTVYKYFTINPIDLTGVTATDYSGTYDKAEHTFTLSGIPAGASISYSDAPEGEYLSTKPARVDAGTTVVYFKINVQNYKTFTGSARIEILPASIEDKETVLTEASYTYDGTAKEPEVTVAGIEKGTDYTVEYVNNMNAGTATVTVTGTGNYTGTISKTFTISGKAITPAVSLDKTSYTYDGKAKKPEVTVKNGDTVLAAGNYIVTYQAGRINVGTYKVTVKMKGNYTGSSTVSFKINPKEVTPAVTLDKTSYVYDGKEKKPAVTVKVGSTVLAAENYAVTYSSGRKEIGTYKVTVTLKGNYSGSKTLSYTIVPGQVTGLKQWTSEYSTSRIKMSWKKVAGAEGYALYRATEKDGTYKLVKTVTETLCTNEGLKAGSKFYYKIRAYKTVSGKKVYGEYSDAVFMVTKPGAPAVTLTAGSKSTKIEWTKSTSANGYEVYMSTSKDGTYTKIKTANASTLSYTKTGLKSGQKYYIKVRAYMTLPDGSKVYSGWSQLKGVTPK